MNDRNQPDFTALLKQGWLMRRTRIVVIAVALCSLSMGIAIGAIVRGTSSATGDDHRLSITNGTASADSLSATFARVAEQVEPSVVHIKVYESEVFAREGTGSGVIVNASGYILTNQHVIERAVKIKVRLASGLEFDAKVIGQDIDTDMAVLKIESREPLAVARLGNSDKLRVGDWVLAMGRLSGLNRR